MADTIADPDLMQVDPRNHPVMPLPSITWDSTIKELVSSIFVLSKELEEAEPEFRRLFADRWIIHWQHAELESVEAANSMIEIRLTARPSWPARITIRA